MVDKQEQAKKIVYRLEEAMDKIREAADILDDYFPERSAFNEHICDIFDDLCDAHGFANYLYNYETTKIDSAI